MTRTRQCLTQQLLKSTTSLSLLVGTTVNISIIVSLEVCWSKLKTSYQRLAVLPPILVDRDSDDNTTKRGYKLCTDFQNVHLAASLYPWELFYLSIRADPGMECSTRLHSIGVPDDVPSTGLTWAYNVKSLLTVKTLLRNIRKTIRSRSHSTDAAPDQGLQC